MTFIRDINTRVDTYLRREGKPGFIEQIKLTPPASEDNYLKFKDALVETIRILEDLLLRGTTELWRTQHSKFQASAVSALNFVSNGTLVATGSFALLGVEAEGPSSTSPWPMANGNPARTGTRQE